MAYMQSLAELEFDTNHMEYHDIIHVTGTIYFVAYHSTDNDGWVATLNITTAGVVTLLDSLEYDTETVFWQKATLLAGSIVAVAYSGNYDGKIQTFSVNTDTGAITTVDSGLFDNTCLGELAIVHISGTIYGIAFRGAQNDGWLATIDIADNGTVGAVQDTWEWNDVGGAAEQFIHISGTTFAMIPGVYLFTLTIANDGTITKSEIDRYTPSSASHTRLLHVAGTVYTVVWRDTTANVGELATIDIAANGTITDTPLDTLEFDSVGLEPNIISLYTGVYLIVYRGSGDWVRGKQVEIADNGTIGNILAAYATSTAYVYAEGYEPVPVKVAGATSIIATIWRGEGNDGYIETSGMQPTVTTQAVTVIVTTTATGNGNVTDLGEPNPNQHGHCWGLSSSPTVSGSKTTLGAVSETGAFTSSITGLTPGLTYYVRAYADNGVTVTYGSEVSFVAGEAVYPSDAITRVTNLIHRYNRAEGTYTLELALGEVTSDFGLPEWLTKPQATTPEEGERRTKDETKTEAVQEEVERIKRQAERFAEQIVKQQEEAEEEKRRADIRLWKAQDELDKEAQKKLQADIDRIERQAKRTEETPKESYPRTRKGLTTEQKRLLGGY